MLNEIGNGRANVAGPGLPPLATDPPSFAGGPQFNEVVPFPSWRRARDKACAALLAGERFLVVTGPPGTGKTLLVQEIARILRFTGWQVSTCISAVPPEADGAATASSALLIDEADRLSDAELRALRSSRHAVLLTGLASLAERCEGSPRISLGPLTAAEARIYVEQWLDQAGLDRSRVQDAALGRIAELSGGVPRLLGALLSGSLWLAGSAPVSPERVDQAAALRECLANPETNASSEPEVEEEAAAPISTQRPRRFRALALTAVVLGLSAAAGAAAARYWPVPAEWRTFVTAYLPRQTQPAAVPRVEAAVARTAAPPPAAPAPPAATVEPARFTEPPVQHAEPPAAAASPILPAPAPPQDTPAVQASAPAAAEPEKPEPTLAPISAPPPAPIAAPATATATATGEALSPALVEILVRRGNEMFALGDYSAARLLFSRAAASGSAAAMLAMGRTYDPAFVDAAASAVTTDPAAAAQWYRLAQNAGNSEAGAFLQRLQRQVAK